MTFSKDDRVRVIDDPGKIGRITGHTLNRGKSLLYQIEFPNRNQYFAEDQIEIAPKAMEDPFDLFSTMRFGRLENLQQILNHIRLAGKLVDHIYSLETTNTDFYPFQFKPVLKMLEAPKNGILIADEVGLGKTIEAGLIWTELKSRYDYNRIFILCPSMLREKWKMEFKFRFGVNAEICNAFEALQILEESKENRNSQFAIIGSIEGMRPHKGWDFDDSDQNHETLANNQLAQYLKKHEEDDPLIDMLIIDEAHYLRNSDTQNFKLGKLLRSVSDSIVLLTATPIHIKSDDLYNLVRLLDEDIFSNKFMFDIVLQANEPLVILRDKLLNSKLSLEDYQKMVDDIMQNEFLQNFEQIKWLGNLNPTQETILDYKFRTSLAHKLDSINFLGNIISRNRKRDVIKNRVIRRPQPVLIPLSKIESEFYSKVTNKIREYCSRTNGFEAFLLVTPQRQMSSSMPAALKYWQNSGRNNDDQMSEDFEFHEDDFVPDDRPVLNELISLSKDFNLNELIDNDTKFYKLVEVLNLLLANGNEKIIIFSFFRATLNYLSDRLKDYKINSILLMGGGNNDKVSIINKFKNDPELNILLSSEIGSEGIDLQFSRTIINYDLPWNPMRIEQRIGRIDRIGQRAGSITIINLLLENTIDSRIYYRLFERLEIFKRTIGLPEAILGEQILSLTKELFKSDLTPEEEEEKINQTFTAIENIKIQEENLEEQAINLLAYGDYITNKVKAARELKKWISEEDIFQYVQYYISKNYIGCKFEPINDEEEFTYNISLSNEAKHDLENFTMTSNNTIRTKLHRLENAPIPCKFSSKISEQVYLGRYEVINHIHPLVRFISYKIEKDSNALFYPAICSKLKKDLAPIDIKEGVYLFVIQKWAVQGLQEKEKLFYKVVNIENPNNNLSEALSESIIHKVVNHGEDWLNPYGKFDWEEMIDIINNLCLANSNAIFDEFKNEYQLSNQDRVTFQLNYLDQHLKNQKMKLTDIRNIHATRNRLSLVAATDARIQNLMNRVDRKKLEITKKSKITAQKDEICVGLIKVE